MKVADSKGNAITAMDQWSKCIRGSHWKPARSAYSLADFVMNRDGAGILERRISSLLAQPVKLEQATPEYRARFDRYRGNPSNLDLGICGRVGGKASLFVGLEAKVDESFGGETVCQRYLSAINERTKNPRSKAADRVEGLLSNCFSDSTGPCASRFSEVRYQLLTGTAGTAARQTDLAVFYILVFKTHLYDEAKGRDNRLAYEKFIRVTGGKLLTLEQDPCQAHRIKVAGKSLVCIYDYFEVSDTE